MKKIIFSFLVLPMIALCFSVNLNAQSSETDLDQVELMKQLVGKWTAETGEDSTLIWEVIPFAKGYEGIGHWQAKGETYSTFKGILGFAKQHELVNMFYLWPDGTLSRDLGKFVSDKKMTLERFNADHTHVGSTIEVNLITADKHTWIFKSRGSSETWDDANVTEYIFTRVKK